jgi:prophage regulatory protein
MQPRKESLCSSDEQVRGERRRAPLPSAPREYLSRRELLQLVPLSMSSIDALEKAGEFPSRFVLSPTTKVCWKRREVIRFLEQRAAKRRVHRTPGAPDAAVDCKGHGGETIEDLVAWPTGKPDAARRQGVFQPKEDDHGA